MFDGGFFRLDASNYFSRISIEELDDVAACCSCVINIAGELYFDENSCYCEDCALALSKEWFEDAQAFAQEQCKVTSKLPAYDPTCEFKCTREEYEGGSRESYTPNAYLCFCRHRCSNYDELIADLDRGDAEDRVYHAVIRHHINERIMDHEDYMHDDDEEDDGPESPTQ